MNHIYEYQCFDTYGLINIEVTSATSLVGWEYCGQQVAGTSAALEQQGDRLAGGGAK